MWGEVLRGKKVSRKVQRVKVCFYFEYKARCERKGEGEGERRKESRGRRMNIREKKREQREKSDKNEVEMKNNTDNLFEGRKKNPLGQKNRTISWGGG